MPSSASRLTAGLLIVAIALLAGCAAPPGELEVTRAWVRPTTGADQPTAAYMVITNGTGQHQKLVSATTPFADQVEMHRTTTDSTGMTAMTMVDEINIPAGGTVALEPGGFHLMVTGLHSALDPAQLEVMPLTLTFEPAGPVDVDADVRASSP